MAKWGGRRTIGRKGGLPCPESTMVCGKSHISVREGVRFSGAGAGPVHHRLNNSPQHFGDSVLWFLGLFLPPEMVLQESSPWRSSLPSSQVS